VTIARRNVLAGMALFSAAAVLPRAAAQPEPGVDDRIAALEDRHTATIGLVATDLASGHTVTHRAQDSFAMCSSFKTYLAACILQLADRGERSLDQQVAVEPAALLPNSPRTEKHAGGQMSLAELCQAALQVSDNAAANLLLHDVGGPQAVTAFARSIGDPRTRLDRYETDLNSAVPGDPRDTSTPEAIAGGYRAVLTGDVLLPPSRQLLDSWMRANETSSMRPALPVGWTSADKTGSGDYGSTNDVGIAYGRDGQRLLLAILTRSAGDDPKAPNRRDLIGELTTLVVPELLQPR
jgi:beta-lactamase class A